MASPKRVTKTKKQSAGATKGKDPKLTLRPNGKATAPKIMAGKSLAEPEDMNLLPNGTIPSPTKAQVMANTAKKRRIEHEDEHPRSGAKRPKPKAAKPEPVLNSPPRTRLDVYVFGANQQGELGLGKAAGTGHVKRPRLNPNLPAASVGIVQLAVGGMHCAALTHDNKILTWGVNDMGALGRDTTWNGGMVEIDAKGGGGDEDSEDASESLNPREAMPTEIDPSAFPEGTVFSQLVAGDNATFALTSTGEVYGWGTFRVSAWPARGRPVLILAKPGQ
jgi:regulator of chromosome condensation